MRTGVIALAMVLLACGGEPFVGSRVHDGDGLEWRLLECRHQDQCMRQAAKLCKNGYVDRNNLQNPRAMMVRCKSDGSSTELADWK